MSEKPRLTAATRLPGTISQWSALAELAGMHITEARAVLRRTGSVILAHLTEDAAKDLVRALAAKGVPAGTEEETEPTSGADGLVRPVIPIRKLSVRQGEPPCIEGRWRTGFPPLSDLLPNVTASCVLRMWQKEDSVEETPSVCGKVTLFNEERERLGAFEIDHMEVNTGTGAVRIRLLETDGILEQSAPCLAVLGDAETVPLDERSRLGEWYDKEEN